MNEEISWFLTRVEFVGMIEFGMGRNKHKEKGFDVSISGKILKNYLQKKIVNKQNKSSCYVFLS